MTNIDWPTMRQMSEAPRDGTCILVNYDGDYFDTIEWRSDRWVGQYNDYKSDQYILGWWPLPSLQLKQDELK